MHRCPCTGAVCSVGARSLVAPDAPVMSSQYTGAYTISCIREHVKWSRRSSSAQVEPVVHQRKHQCNAVTVAREISCTGCTGDEAPV